MWSRLFAVPLVLSMLACGGSRSETEEEPLPEQAPVEAGDAGTEDVRGETSRVGKDTVVTRRTVVDTTIVTVDSTVALDTTITVDTTFKVDTTRAEGGRGEIVDTTR